MESRSRLIAEIVLALGIASTPAHAQSQGLEADRDLQQIAYFSAITASVHNTSAAGPDPDTGISPESLTQYLRRQFGVHFPGVPYRPVDAGTVPDSGSDAGSLSCRIWADGEKQPVVFQVRCQISTSTRMNVIGDASFGYAPPEIAPTIIREQIDHILRGLAVTFFRAKRSS